MGDSGVAVSSAAEHVITSPTDTITNIPDECGLEALHGHDISKSNNPPAKRRGCTAGQVKSCIRTFLVHLFSHVGLCIVVVGYAICGGFLFNELESKPQLARVDKSHANYNRTIYEARLAYVRHLWKITEKFNVLYEKEWNQAVEAELTQFSEIISNSTEQKRISEEEITWTFSRALLYSVSIITTIGYGDLAPKTDAGRVLTMFYAILGVPLMLLWVSNIGTVMANTFKFIYVHAKCCSPVSPSKKQSKTSKAVQPSSVMATVNATGATTGTSTILIVGNNKHKRKSSKNSSASDSSAHPLTNNVGGAGSEGVARTNSILSRKSSFREQTQVSGSLAPVSGSASQVEYSLADRKYETRIVDSSGMNQQQISFCCPQSSTSLSPSPLLSLKDLHSGAKQVLLECAQYNLNNCCPGRTNGSGGGGGQDDESSRRILQQLYYNTSGSLMRDDGVAGATRCGDELSEDLNSSEMESIIEIKVAPPPPPSTEASSDGMYYSSGGPNSVYLMPDPNNVPPTFPPPCCTSLYNSDPTYCQSTPPPPPPPFGYGTVLVMTSGTGGGGGGSLSISDTTSSTLRKSSFGSISTGSGSLKTSNNGNKKSLTMPAGSLHHLRGNSIKRSHATAPTAEGEVDDDDSLNMAQGTPSRIPLLSGNGGGAAGGNARGQPDVVDVDNFGCNDYDEISSTGPFKRTRSSKAEKKARERARKTQASLKKQQRGGKGSGDGKAGTSSSTEPDIPISLVLFVVLAYILAGAGAFTILEDWGFIEGAYFCFITLSTIGLGDILPGKTVDSVPGSTAGAAKLVFCCLYLVLGLAIIAMSFNLVQEKVSTGVKNFGRRIGVLKDEDEEDDDSYAYGEAGKRRS